MAVQMVSFDRRVFNRQVPLPGRCLPENTGRGTTGPRMVRLGQAALNAMCFADHVEAHMPRTDGVPVARLPGEPEALACKNGKNLTGYGFGYVLREPRDQLSVSRFNGLSYDKPRRPPLMGAAHRLPGIGSMPAGRQGLPSAVCTPAMSPLEPENMHFRAMDVEEPPFGT